jgi:large subunit ribosomal protein L22
MTGAKTNERPGVRAQHRYAHVSAYKAREVLDLIRGKSVAEARAILEFTERAVAGDILKVLDSAVANAGNNNSIAPEELYVSACYADEGPTLRRYRPRARGRAGRIRKRTSHITVIVGRYSAVELERLREQRAGRRAATTDARASRARRVARSRQRSGADEEAQTPDEAVEEVVDDTFAETAEDAQAGEATEGAEVEATEAEAAAVGEVVEDTFAEIAEEDGVADSGTTESAGSGDEDDDTEAEGSAGSGDEDDITEAEGSAGSGDEDDITDSAGSGEASDNEDEN